MSPVYKTCPECGQPFARDPSHARRYTYCSWSCWSAARAKAHPPIIKTCPQCGAEFRVTPAEMTGRHYCSMACYVAARAEPMHRFWRFVDRSGDCWIWTGARQELGYGSFSLGGKNGQVGAHRFAYELLVGPIPEGMTIDHLCRNPACVNPAHLEVVTPGENTLRGTCPSAVNKRKTHCKRGHPFDEENTCRRRLPNGHIGRRCRACQRKGARDHD